MEVPYEKLGLITSNSSNFNESDRYKDDLKFLREFYKPCNEKLYQLTGVNYGWNNS